MSELGSLQLFSLPLVVWRKKKSIVRKLLSKALLALFCWWWSLREFQVEEKCCDYYRIIQLFSKVTSDAKCLSFPEPIIKGLFSECVQHPLTGNTGPLRYFQLGTQQLRCFNVGVQTMHGPFLLKFWFCTMWVLLLLLGFFSRGLTGASRATDSSYFSHSIPFQWKCFVIQDKGFFIRQSL